MTASRFNPPPDWPSPPAGWQPHPGWKPDPDWPTPPPGWNLWIDDGQEPKQWEIPGLTDPVGSQALAAGLTDRKNAVIRFWLGVAVFVVAAVSTLAANDGGVIWTGGLLVGALLIFKSTSAYRRSEALGVPRMGAVGWAAVCLAGVACLAVGGFAGMQYLEAEQVASTVNDVGSCWTSAAEEKLEAVSCSDSAAEYVASAGASDPATCPAASVGYVTGHKGQFLCLEDR